MAFEVGQIVEGKVTGIMSYGAFIDLGDGISGMVHISEVAQTYVKEINEYLSIGQEVKVKILSIDDRGKISLSIKQAMPKQQGVRDRGRRGGNQNGGQRRSERTNRGGSDNYDWNRKQNSSDNFDDMLSKFMAASDEKISGLKKQQSENRRGRKGGNQNGDQW